MPATGTETKPKSGAASGAPCCGCDCIDCWLGDCGPCRRPARDCAECGDRLMPNREGDLCPMCVIRRDGLAVGKNGGRRTGSKPAPAPEPEKDAAETAGANGMGTSASASTGSEPVGKAICRRPANQGKPGWKLCSSCGKQYHKPNYDRCYECAAAKFGWQRQPGKAGR